MNNFELVTNNGFVKVVDRVAQTENKPINKEITCQIGKMRSSHLYDEAILNFLVKKLKEGEDTTTYAEYV